MVFTMHGNDIQSVKFEIVIILLLIEMILMI